MFVLRDIIGGFESYRLFKEDELDHSPLSSESKRLSSLRNLLSDNAGKETLLSVLILEPHLVDSIRRIYPELISDFPSAQNIKIYTEAALLDSATTLDSGRLRFLLSGLFTIAPESFCSYRIILAVLRKIDGVGPAATDLLNYVGFVYTALLFRTREGFTERMATNAKLLIQKLYLRIDQTKQHGKLHAGLIKELYNEVLLSLDDFPLNAEVKLILEVRQYYLLQVSNHGGRKSSPHPNFYTGFSSIKNRLGTYLKVNPSEEEKVQLYKDLRELVETADARLFKSLSPVLDFLKQFQLSNDSKVDIRAHQKSLEQFDKLLKSVQDEPEFIEKSLKKGNIGRLLTWVNEFNERFFNLDSELPMFFKHSHANLRRVVLGALNEHEVLEGSLDLSIEIPEGIELSVDPYLLRMVMYELFANKVKHARGVSARVVYAEDEKQISITYLQESSFQEGIAENGLITIRNIVSNYGGQTRIEGDPWYTVTLVFPMDRKIDPNEAATAHTH